MSDYTIVNGELVHYGVPGMKWGRRKARETTSYGAVQKKKKAMDDAAANVAAAKVRKKTAHDDWYESYKELQSPVKNWGPGGKAVRSTAEKNVNAANKATKDYKNAKKDYRSAKKDYKREMRKDNEAYANSSKKMQTVDSMILNSGGKQHISRTLNRHENMTVSQARKSTYIQAGVNTVGVLMAGYGLYKLTR
jgi:hypothetical protein